MPSRRDLLKAGGLGLAGVAFPGAMQDCMAAGLAEIRMRSVRDGEHMVFDPVGILVQPGTRIRWIIESDVHTATAYHPANDAHPLRIPRAAKPWDSGYLVNPGDSYEITLTEEGVYDYFCAPHELAGMVGRIIVGRPSGPGARPFGYHLENPDTPWKTVPEAARKTFPSIAEILQKRVISAH